MPVVIDEVVRSLGHQPELKGWSLVVQPAPRHRIAVEAQDPVLGQRIVFGMSEEQWRARGTELIKRFVRHPDIAVINRVPSHPTNPQLLVEVRQTAAAYSWSFETFRQVIQLLDESGVIRTDEFEWLLDAGPWSHPFWTKYRFDRPAWRGLGSGSAEEQYKAFRGKYYRAKRRALKRPPG